MAAGQGDGDLRANGVCPSAEIPREHVQESASQKVLSDWLRDGRMATAVAPLSTRARAERSRLHAPQLDAGPEVARSQPASTCVACRRCWPEAARQPTTVTANIHSSKPSAGSLLPTKLRSKWSSPERPPPCRLQAGCHGGAIGRRTTWDGISRKSNDCWSAPIIGSGAQVALFGRHLQCANFRYCSYPQTYTDGVAETYAKVTPNLASQTT